MRGHIAALLAALAAALGSPFAHAASGYDVSDLWWSPAESGWGLVLAQQRDIVFASVLVYDAAQKPTWYVATLAFQGLTPQTREVNYAGPLYATTGPWFGAVPFVPSAVAPRQVGTMQLRSPDLIRATLTYTVDGLAVTKAIERQTLREDDYAGTYDAAFVITRTRCNNPAEDGTRTERASMQVAQVPGTMTLAIASENRNCTYAGPYSQYGRLGSVFSNYTCTSGEAGALVFDEMNVQRFGAMGIVYGSDNRGCHIEGRFAGVRP